MLFSRPGSPIKFAGRHKIVAAIAVAFALALAFRFLGGSGAGKPRVLDSAVVSPGTVVRSLSATGVVTPEVGAIVKIGSRATGIIRRMHVRVGGEVKSGQIIAEIDSRELEAQAREAEAALTRAQVEVRRIQATYPLQILEAEAQLASAAASSDYYALNFKRRQTLVAQDLDARDTLDVARQQMISARQTMAAAQATVIRLREEFGRQRESAAQARIQAEAALATARIRLDYATIRSPLDGVVSQVTAQEGETVVAGLQVVNLITVLDPSRLEMWVYVDETDVGQVRPGMRVEFTVDSLPGSTFTGQVSLIYPEPEIKDSIVYYQTLVPLDKESALRLKPRMTTQCRVVVDSKEGVLAVPNEALKWVNGRQVVYLVGRKGGVTPVVPRLGMRGSQNSEVLQGLKDGDVVATRLILGDLADAVPGVPGGGHGGGGR